MERKQRPRFRVARLLVREQMNWLGLVQIWVQVEMRWMVMQGEVTLGDPE